MIQIDSEKCIRCGTCVAICPETVFIQRIPKTEPQLVHTELCFACGQCIALCPQQAIEHESFSGDQFSPILPDVMPSWEQESMLLQITEIGMSRSGAGQLYSRLYTLGL